MQLPLDTRDPEQGNEGGAPSRSTLVAVPLMDHAAKSVKHPTLPPPLKDFVESRRDEEAPRLESPLNTARSVKEMKSLWEVRVLGQDSSRSSDVLPAPAQLPRDQPSDPFLGPPAEEKPSGERPFVLRLMKGASSGFVEGLKQASMRGDEASAAAPNKPTESLRLFHANPEPVLSRHASGASTPRTSSRRRSSVLPLVMPLSPGKGGGGAGLGAPSPESANATWGKALESRRMSWRSSIVAIAMAKKVVGRMKTLVDENVFKCEVPLSSGDGSVQLHLQSTGQQTMIFTKSVALKDFLPSTAVATIAATYGADVSETTVLPAMTANLYLYPKVAVEGGSMRVLTPPEQEGFLQLLLLLLADGEASALFQRSDAVGAAPLHALLVANTPQALELSMSLIWAQPTLLLQVHAQWGPFDGESVLHVLAANQQEGLLVDGLPARSIPGVLEIALTKLSKSQYQELWLSLARGPFFTAMPMRHFGGSALGYLSCFGMKRALLQVLSSAEATGNLDLNDPAQACAITGYLPIHAVVACGMRDMYNFLIELPNRKNCAKLTPERRAVIHADHEATTAAAPDGTQLTPLQLAALMGNHTMVKHILHRQTRTLWKWGPVTQYEMDLRGVDSAGGGANDLMELVGHIDAAQPTAEMVLDDFIAGAIWGLFQQKWEQYGRRVWRLVISIDGGYLFALIALCFTLKIESISQAGGGETDPEHHLGSTLLLTPLVLLAAAAVLCLEGYFISRWWSEQDGESNAPAAGSSSPEEAGAVASILRAMEAGKRAAYLLRWLASFMVPQKLISVLLAVISCILLLTENAPPPLAAAAPLAAGGRLLLENDGGWLAFGAGANVAAPSFTIGGDAARGPLPSHGAAHELEPWRRAGAALPLHATRELSTAASRLSNGSPRGVPWAAAAAAAETGAGGAPGDDDDASWKYYRTFALLAASCFLMLNYMMNLVVMPLPKLAILMLSVNRMLIDDLRIFMALFLMFLFNFFVAMFIVYPAPAPQAAQFNALPSAVRALIDLGFVGEPIQLDLAATEGLRVPSMWETVDLSIFVVLYYGYVLVAMVLLLNLLIALMGNTFAKVTEEATLQYRRDFARRVLRLELIAVPPLINEEDRFVGAKDQCNGRYYYAFRSVDANVEGINVGGGANIFGANAANDADGDMIPDDEDFDMGENIED